MDKFFKILFFVYLFLFIYGLVTVLLNFGEQSFNF